MAKVTFGPIVSEARNKVGGVVFSRNPHGAYSRTWLVPHNPNTTAQAAARLSMRELSQRWASTLTDEQRAAWRSLGKLYPHIDVFRQKSVRPGLQTYLRSNLALASVGSPPLDDAPRKLSASDPAQVTATAASGSPPLITVNCDSAPAINEAVQIWVSRQLSTGQTYFYKYMRLVATFSAGTAGPWGPSAGWAARFTALTFPSKLGIGVRYVNIETGATGPMRTALITTTAGGDILLQQILDLTNADILALPTAPLQLLPAAPTGFTYTLIACDFLGNIPTNYTNVGDRAFIRAGGTLSLCFNDPPDGIGGITQLLLGAGPKRTVHAGIVGNQPYSNDYATYPATSYYNTDWDNVAAPLMLTCQNWDSPAYNDLGNFTGGDPANIIRVVLYYALSPTP